MWITTLLFWFTVDSGFHAGAIFRFRASSYEPGWPRSHLTSKSFVKTLMCSYERAGWLGYRDLGFSNRDLGKRAGNFAIWTLHPGYREENNTMHFLDRTGITELLILFSSIMKLGIVLFDSNKRNLRLFKQRKSRNSRQACSLDFTPEWSRHHFFKSFISESGLKVTLLYGKLRERAVCGEFCVLIGYPSGQDGAILPARDCPFRSRK